MQVELSTKFSLKFNIQQTHSMLPSSSMSHTTLKASRSTPGFRLQGKGVRIAEKRVVQETFEQGSGPS